MTQPNPKAAPSLLAVLILSGAALWAYPYAAPYRDTQLFFIPALALILAARGAVALLRVFLDAAVTFCGTRQAMKRSVQKGSAKWGRLADLRGLLKRKNAPFWGMQDGRGVFIPYESVALTVAPAGSGKTVSTVIPQLLALPKSMAIIAPDYKGELAVCTKDARETKGQPVFTINPGGFHTGILGVPSRYNPLAILADDWSDSPRDLIADARAIAFQLHPEPARATENQFFRAGSRRIILFACVSEVIAHGHAANLPGVLRLVSDPSRFAEALYVASVSDALDGELADMAHDFLKKTDDGDTRQWESFREGAMQALETFGVSGRLAESVSACDFRFRGLKEKPATIFIVGDPTRMKVFAPWLGLVMWSAITELTRCRSDRPVTLLLDEAANFKIEELPDHLTRLRSFGVRFHIVLQELQDFARVYSKDALETLLSQAEIQQFFGARSPGTLELLAKRLGETTVKTQSWNLGGKGRPTRSVSEAGRSLMTADEIRRHEDVLLFVRNKPPMSLQKLGYHEVSPWNRLVRPNPLHGKRLRGRIKLWLW